MISLLTMFSTNRDDMFRLLQIQSIHVIILKHELVTIRRCLPMQALQTLSLLLPRSQSEV